MDGNDLKNSVVNGAQSLNDPNKTGREKVDETLDGAATEMVKGTGVPEPIAKKAVQTRGGRFFPGNTFVTRGISNKARNLLGSAVDAVSGESDENAPRKSPLSLREKLANFNDDSSSKEASEQSDASDNPEDVNNAPTGSPQTGNKPDSGLEKAKNATESPNSKGVGSKLNGLKRKEKPAVDSSNKKAGLGQRIKSKLGNKSSKDSKDSKGNIEEKVKNKLLSLAKAHPMATLIILGVAALLLLVLFIAASFSGSGSAGGSGTTLGDGEFDDMFSCERISISKTSLSQDEFGELLKAYKNDSFAENYKLVYDIAVGSSINPEMVVMDAARRSYKPGNNYNYWMLGCAKSESETTYQSFDDFEAGVTAYVDYLKSFSSVQVMLEKEAQDSCFNDNPDNSATYVEDEFNTLTSLRKKIFNLDDNDCYDFQFNYSGDYSIDPDNSFYSGLSLLHGPTFESILKNHGYSINDYNEFLLSRISNAGIGTREGVVEAAVSLIGSLAQMGIKINYRWGGKYAKIGANPKWGEYLDNPSCEEGYASHGYDPEKCKANYVWIGFDCSGFVTWAVINGMQDASIKQGDTSSGVRHKLDPNNAVCKPGSVLDKLGVHIALVVGVDPEKKKYIVAESTGSNVSSGTGGVKLSYYDFGKTDYDCINMENIYGE